MRNNIKIDFFERCFKYTIRNNILPKIRKISNSKSKPLKAIKLALILSTPVGLYLATKNRDSMTIAKSTYLDKVVTGSESVEDPKESYNYQEQTLTAYEYIKMIFGILILIPLRLIIIIPLNLVIQLLLLVAHPCSYNAEKTDPYLNSFERIARFLMQHIVRIAMFVMGFYHIKVNDSPDPRANVFVSNHVSVYDIWYLIYGLGPSFISKDSIKNVPLVGSIAKFLRTIFVNRHTKESREKCINEINNRFSTEKTDSVLPLIIFPEGTTTNGKCLIPFKLGAFYSGNPVQPIALQYKFARFNPAYTGMHSENGKVVSTSLSFYMLRLLSQFSHSLEVSYLPLYFPSEEEKNSPTLYAKNVQKAIADRLLVPIKNVDKYYFK